MTFRLALVDISGATGLACSQTGARELVFLMRQGGPLPPRQTVALAAGTPWKSAVSGAGWLHVSPPQGTGPVPVTVGAEASWGARRQPPRKPCVNHCEGPAEPLHHLRIVPRAPDPKFTYVSPPRGCSAVPGLPDEASCIVPDEAPAGNFRPPEVGGADRDPELRRAGPRAGWPRCAPRLFHAERPQRPQPLPPHGQRPWRSRHYRRCVRHRPQPSADPLRRCGVGCPKRRPLLLHRRREDRAVRRFRPPRRRRWSITPLRHGASRA